MTASPPSTVAAVVLAAGGARRYGGAKQLAEVDGRPLVAHAVDSAVAAGLVPVVVVVGSRGDAVANAIAGRATVEVVANPAWSGGQATSLAAGLDALAEREPPPDVAVVLLADQPGVTAAAVRSVAAAVAAGAPIARARYDDAPSHPVALARAVWPRAAALEGDTGARALFAELGVVDVRVPGPAPRDVDRPADLDGLGGTAVGEPVDRGP